MHDGGWPVLLGPLSAAFFNPLMLPKPVLKVVSGSDIKASMLQFERICDHTILRRFPFANILTLALQVNQGRSGFSINTVHRDWHVDQACLVVLQLQWKHQIDTWAHR